MPLLDTTKRRFKFKRSNPQPIKLTADDIAITRYIAQHRFRRSSDVFRHLSHRSEKKIRERLRKLYDRGILDRPLAQRDDHTMDGKAHIIYALGNHGARLLSEFDGLVAPKSNWTAKNRTVGRHHIHHTLRIADLADATHRLPHYDPSVAVLTEADILSTAPPIIRRDPKPWHWQARVRLADGTLRPTTAVPDYVFGLDFTTKRKRYFFFCEADRATMPIVRSNHKRSSVARKFEAYLSGYHACLHTSRYGIGNLRFLTITTTQQRIQTMLEALTNIAGSLDTSMFFFADFNQITNAEHILAVPWINGRGDRTPLLT